MPEAMIPGLKAEDTKDEKDMPQDPQLMWPPLRMPDLEGGAEMSHFHCESFWGRIDSD